jgi:hypothetical protein
MTSKVVSVYVEQSVIQSSVTIESLRFVKYCGWLLNHQFVDDVSHYYPIIYNVSYFPSNKLT